MAINAINTNSIAAIFTASFKPSDVPIEIESNRLVPIFSLEIFTSLSIFSVSGNNIFEITIAPGAAITDAARRCFA